MQYLLEHKMTSLPPRERKLGTRRRPERQPQGRDRDGARTASGVIVATGGQPAMSISGACSTLASRKSIAALAGMPYSDQDASGEIAGMQVGAALWGLTNFALEHGSALTKPARSAPNTAM